MTTFGKNSLTCPSISLTKYCLKIPRLPCDFLLCPPESIRGSEFNNDVYDITLFRPVMGVVNLDSFVEYLCRYTLLYICQRKLGPFRPSSNVCVQVRPSFNIPPYGRASMTFHPRCHESCTSLVFGILMTTIRECTKFM